VLAGLNALKDEDLNGMMANKVTFKEWISGVLVPPPGVAVPKRALLDGYDTPAQSSHLTSTSSVEGSSSDQSRVSSRHSISSANCHATSQPCRSWSSSAGSK